MTTKMPPARYTAWLGHPELTRFVCDCRFECNEEAKMLDHIALEHAPWPEPVPAVDERDLLIKEFAKGLADARYAGLQEGLKKACLQLEREAKLYTNDSCRRAVLAEAEGLKEEAESIAVAAGRADEDGWWK